MRDKSPKAGIKPTKFALLFTVVLYTILSLLAVLMYGSDLKKNLLDNIVDAEGSWESYVIRISFLLTISCHIPFVFFYGKETLLLMIDEVDRRSVSRRLTTTLHLSMVQEEEDGVGVV